VRVEQQLAAQLWEKVPEGSLVIGDRLLLERGRTLWQATQGLGVSVERGHRLSGAGARETSGWKVVQRLPDGSAHRARAGNADEEE